MALLFVGTTAIAQCTARNVAGGQIQPVGVAALVMNVFENSYDYFEKKQL